MLPMGDLGWRLTEQHEQHLRRFVSSEFGDKLASVFKTKGWAGLFRALLNWHPLNETHHPALRWVWKAALIEVWLFDHHGCQVSWCSHGKHWFIREDARRTDCIRHRLAGQQSRWRMKRRKKQRAEEAAKSIEHLERKKHAGTLAESRSEKVMSTTRR